MICLRGNLQETKKTYIGNHQETSTGCFSGNQIYINGARDRKPKVDFAGVAT